MGKHGRKAKRRGPKPPPPKEETRSMMGYVAWPLSKEHAILTWAPSRAQCRDKTILALRGASMEEAGLTVKKAQIKLRVIL